MNNILTKEEVELLQEEIKKIFVEHKLAPQEGIQVLLTMAMQSIYYFSVDPKNAILNIARGMIEEAEKMGHDEACDAN